MPSLTQLKYILAVAQHKHFGKAAEICNVSQPSLSMQIQKAEEELGIVLFDRESKPISLTSKGRVIAHQAQIVIDEHERLLQMSKEEQGEIKGEYRLGVIPTLAPNVVPLFIAKFSADYPKVNLFIEELTTESTIKALREGKIDSGLLVTPLYEKGLLERPLFYEPFYLYANKSAKILKKQTVTPEVLSQQSNLWLLQDGHCFRNQILNLCKSSSKKTGLLSNVSFESGNLETLRDLVNKVGGYTLLPHLFVKKLSKAESKSMVREILNPRPVREVSMVYRRGIWKREIIEPLIDCIINAIPKELRKKPLDNYEVVEI